MRSRSCSWRSRRIRISRPFTAISLACYAHLGRLDEARETIARLRAFCPAVGIDYYLRSPEQHELYLSGLRLAAGEDA